MKYVITLIMAVALSVAAVAQERYEKCQLAVDGDTLRYCALAPQTVQPGEKYPLVVFLHGAGERGEDNEAQLFHGS
ncbi:MAG: phospholipase, partial [bacterium]|nr:phospholipase [bacterium]